MSHLNRSPWLPLAFCLLFAVILIGCTPARMAVSPELTAAAPEMPLNGSPQYFWQDGFSFGPYKVSGKDRSWTSTTSFGSAWRMISFDSAGSRQNLQFILSGPGGAPLACQCTTRANRQMLKAMDKDWGELSAEVSGQVNYACSFRPVGGGMGWDMAMTRGVSRPEMHGFVLGSLGQVQVVGTRALKGTSIPLSDPTGYQFMHQGRMVAAVEVINSGAVWIAPDLPAEARNGLAAAASALLLYQEINRN